MRKREVSKCQKKYHTPTKRTTLVKTGSRDAKINKTTESNNQGRLLKERVEEEGYPKKICK